MTRFTVRQNGNRVEVHGGPEIIFYELGGMDLPPLTDFSFAIWHMLPQAMQTGDTIEIDGPADPLVIENARKLSRIWEMWVPSTFYEVGISATESAPAPANRHERLTFFSGGVDSTHMLLRLGRQPEPAFAMTVQGMDYPYATNDQFQALQAMARPFLNSLNYQPVVLRSNAVIVARGYHAWGMALTGHAFLMSGLFKQGIFAADFTPEQDMAAFPWGQNHVTNRYSHGRHFSFDPLCEDTTRTEKVALIATNDLALQALSFCKRPALRPQNCGRCYRCVRTKAMFAGMTGQTPNIFMDNSYGEETINLIDFSDQDEVTFLIDLYQRAKARDMLAHLPGLERRINEEVRKKPGSLRRLL